ncbi:MAG: radical SAM protein [Deltaproteobacteria bacterium]|nr:radical SAM protein [Deltaproteobacteria bacterium]
MRTTWRPHTLDGALLWFQPGTGLSVRVDGPETRALRRRAPRLVLFGITNKCNLACTFCSRDQTAASAWTADDAYHVLAGLARRGTLEVAFGGGEPLAFRGFDDLVERLATTTPLALHVTTNGTLLTPARLARLRPHLGELRLSLYDENDWAARLRLLASVPGRFGVNLLLTPARVAGLPGLLADLAGLGCQDVALLSYVGPDPALHLSAADDTRVAAAIAAAPAGLRVRLSVCFGDRLHDVPRLFAGVAGDGDCGAGLDFVTLTSDRRLEACSYQRGGLPITSADDVLAAWQARRPELLGPAGARGCARPAAPRATLPDGVRIWRGFSGNNSGDCVLVGRFADGDAAQRYLDELLPGFVPGDKYPQPWLDLLAREGIEVAKFSHAPDVMAAVGRSILMHTDMALEDDFAELRTLLWKRGGRAVYSGIHVHDTVTLVAGLRFPDAAARDAAHLELCANDDRGTLATRGLDLYGLLDVRSGRRVPHDLPDQLATLRGLAKRHGASLAAELAEYKTAPAMPGLLSARPPAADAPEWLWARMPDKDIARRVAPDLGPAASLADRYILVAGAGPGSISPRAGFIIQRAGGTAEVLRGVRLRLDFSLWRADLRVATHKQRKTLADLPVPDPSSILAELRAWLGAEVDLALQNGEHDTLVGHIATSEPAFAMSALLTSAHNRGFTLWLDLRPGDPIADSLARVAADLTPR